MAKEITIQAPEGFEFDSDKPVYIKKGEWFLKWLDEDMFAKQAITNTDFPCYRLRKVWKPKQGEFVVVRRADTKQDRFIIKLENECEGYYHDNFGFSHSKEYYELRPLTPEERGE